MTKFEVWSSGYIIQGNSATASLYATVEADSFDEAVLKLGEKDGNIYYDTINKRHTHWGCELFDNEADARKSFG